MAEQLVIAGRAFGSRLIVGTGNIGAFRNGGHTRLPRRYGDGGVRRVNLSIDRRSRCSTTSTGRRFSFYRIRGVLLGRRAVRAARLGAKRDYRSGKAGSDRDEQTLFPDTQSW